MSGLRTLFSRSLFGKNAGGISWLLIYIVAWQPVFHLMPAEVFEKGKQLVVVISTVIPSIAAYAVNSPDPVRVSVFMAVNWCLYPFYITLGIRRYGRQILMTKYRLPKGQAILLTLFALILVPVPMLLPTEIGIDPLAIRPYRFWNKWMHEMLWPNGVFAVLLPLWSVGFLLVAWIAFRLIPFNTTTRGH